MSSSPRPRPASLLWSMPGPRPPQSGPGAPDPWNAGKRHLLSLEPAHLGPLAVVNGKRLPVTCPNQDWGVGRKDGEVEVDRGR